MVARAFDDPNRVSSTGPVPGLDRQSPLAYVAWLMSTARYRRTGEMAGLQVASLVGGMVAGADSIDDMALRRPASMGRAHRRMGFLGAGVVPVSTSRPEDEVGPEDLLVHGAAHRAGVQLEPLGVPG